MTKQSKWLEKFFGDEISIEWEDELSGCSDCGAAVRTSPDCYAWEGYYVLGDGELICGDCVKKDAKAALEMCGFVNSTKRAIPSWFIPCVNALGFDCPESDKYMDMCKHYETGWHSGQNDTPEKALASMYELVGKEFFDSKMDYVFAITGKGQFDIRWTILIRPKDYEER